MGVRFIYRSLRKADDLRPLVELQRMTLGKMEFLMVRFFRELFHERVEEGLFIRSLTK